MCSFGALQWAVLKMSRSHQVLSDFDRPSFCCTEIEVFAQETADRINSLDFHRVEDLLVTAGDDDSIRTYNTLTGQNSKVLFSKKYGVAHIRFTHDPQSVIYASTKACVPSAQGAGETAEQLLLLYTIAYSILVWHAGL